MKTFATLTVAGVAGLLVLKLLAAVVLPVLGVAFGLLAFVVKLAVIIALGYFVYSVLKKARSVSAA
jgi:hypothetical protein